MAGPTLTPPPYRWAAAASLVDGGLVRVNSEPQFLEDDLKAVMATLIAPVPLLLVQVTLPLKAFLSTGE